jgi:hypothetical protein
MKAKRISAAIAAIAMAVSLTVPMSASADTVYSTTIEGTKVTSFDKYLVMPKDATVPSAGFSFSIQAGEAVDAKADGTTLPVSAGVGTPKFVLKTATGANNDNDGTADTARVNFTSGDAATAEASVATGKTVKFTTTSDTSDEKFAQKKIEIDFSGISFQEPGIYRYIITEAAAGTDQAAGVTNDTDSTRVLDVVVEDSSEGSVNKLKIRNYILHDNVSDVPVKAAGNTATIEDKSSGFTNKYDAYDLVFSKTVKGNQGSKDKYFKFDVSISGAKGAEIAVSGQGTDFAAEPEKSTSTTHLASDMKTANTKDEDTDLAGQQLKADADGNITATFYIKHGQKVTLQGIPAGAKYTVTETQEDYTASVSVTETADSSDAAANSDKNGITDETTGIQGNTTAAFTNTREGTIPTGILSNVALPAGIISLAVAGAVGSVIYIKKKKSEEE